MKTYQVHLVVMYLGSIEEEDYQFHNNYEKALQSQARMLESAKEEHGVSCEYQCTIEEINK